MFVQMNTLILRAFVGRLFGFLVFSWRYMVELSFVAIINHSHTAIFHVPKSLSLARPLCPSVLIQLVIDKVRLEGIV